MVNKSITSLSTRPSKFRKHFYIQTIFFSKGSYIMALSSCNKCGGRGYIGHDVKRNVYLRCGCVKATGLPIKWIQLG